MPAAPPSVLRWPSLTCGLSLLLMAVFIAWSGLALLFLTTENSQRTSQIRELEQLRGRITHLDEVLTMSANMAAASGEGSFVDRYFEHETLLGEAIAQASALAPSAGSAEAAETINTANDALVAMEYRALALVRASRNVEARALLESAAYREQKQLYAAGLEALGASLSAESQRLKAEQDKDAALAIVPGGALFLVLLAGGLFSLRALRRWRVHVWAVNEELVRQRHELAEMNTSERKQAQTRLIESNRALRAEAAARTQAESDLDLMFSTTPDMLALGGFDGYFKRVNPTMVHFSGRSEQELLCTPLHEFVDPEQLPAVMADMEKLARGEEVHDMYLRIRHKDGHFLETEWHNVPFVARGQFLTVGRDISKRKEGERRLLEANEALKSEIAARAQAELEFDRMFALTPDMMAVGGFDGVFRRVNPAMLQTMGYTEEELLRTPFDQLSHPEDLAAMGEQVAKLARGEEVHALRFRVRHKDGRYIHTEWTDVPFLDRGVFFTMGRDVTQREEDEHRLMETNEALKAEIEARARTQSELDQLFTASQDLMALASFDDRLQRVNPSFCKAFGYTAEELLAMPFSEFVPAEDLPMIGERVARVAAGETLTGVVTRICTKDGRIRHTQWNLVPFANRNVFYATGRDITERMELEESLRKTAATLAEAQRIGKVGSWDVDLTTGVSKWSDEAFRIYGLEPGEVAPTMDFFFSTVHPDDREKVRQNNGHTPRNGEHYLTEHRIVLKDGAVRDMLNNMEFECAPDGRPLKIFGTCQDITDRKNAERKQTKLEEQLRASQKMEAVGSLAGGIAHDFNNLLSVILSYVGFVLDDLPSGDSRRDDLVEVNKAAERAASLTRQLLAFGRKQVLQPVPLNLNQVAAGMEKMLRRIIGEDISMNQNLDPELGLTMADPGQIEQVTMNLVVNARDAMPAGGCLTIETGNVEIREDQQSGLKPGPYVTLTVSDSGTGMDNATLAHMFEPFFTTKEVGKGTGLGLSTVYGIVKQSGGHVTVYSEPGVGSTFRVYLPRDLSAPPTDGRRSTAPLQLLGKETILVVEDEAAVRAGAERILNSSGYSVLTAGNGVEGLEILRSFPGEIDLVLTDVVMPKMGGALFARELTKLRPEARILFMSGYSGDAIAHHGMLEPGTQFIGKPFNVVDLTRKVRRVLDADREVYSTDPTDVAVRRKEAS